MVCLKVDWIDGGASVLVVVGLSAELAQAVLDGDGRVYVHIDLDGFHLRRMELKQPQLGVDAVAGTQRDHVCLKVRDVEG